MGRGQPHLTWFMPPSGPFGACRGSPAPSGQAGYAFREVAEQFAVARTDLFGAKAQIVGGGGVCDPGPGLRAGVGGRGIRPARTCGPGRAFTAGEAVVGAVAAEEPVAAQGGGDHVGGAQRLSAGDVADVALGGQAATAGCRPAVTSNQVGVAAVEGVARHDRRPGGLGGGSSKPPGLSLAAAPPPPI
jgi:hypothetical protein